MNKKRIVISNAFSINMLKEKANLSFQKITIQEAKSLLSENETFLSIVGHEATAKIFSQILEIEIPQNRIPYSMKKEDILIVGSLNVRLPEGKILSEEELKQIKITFWKIEYIKKKKKERK